MSHQRSTRVVFGIIILYDYTEEQLTEIFKEVGPVVSFRLVFDRESGKPRGYGFCEYQDAETAASAVRNLNSYEVGGRELRVDYADNDKEDNHDNNNNNNNNSINNNSNRVNNNSGNNNFQHDDNRKNFNNRTNNMQNTSQNVQQNQNQNQQNQSIVENIQNTVNMLPQRELLELMSQIKTLIETNPVAARNLLTMNPQLSYAVFQALLTLNIVDPNVIQRILQVHMNDSNASMQNQQMSQQNQMSNMTQNQGMNNQNMNMNAVNKTLSQFNGGDMLQEQQKQLLMQVMSLTPDQLSSLPPDQRENIMALKAQIMGNS
ncbi:hypothetical protein BCR36DRAFT_586827 [Piromyces finnis]|uniref:RRM domain-containing protein n=1 Tax=Piromyces finnis TaxID=1754191 RepID=A0A1Y1V061_9FUNG|nr:hypothetical protein BCR36DRAFT_586827 [Piromyces finnis]|eukprot:ORX43157.1 hypothetical protein BCR36DRAFT_586827 [Piromyces finnis]